MTVGRKWLFGAMVGILGLAVVVGGRAALDDERTLFTLLPTDTGTGGGAGLVRMATLLGKDVREVEVPLSDFLREAEPDATVLTAGNQIWHPARHPLAPSSAQSLEHRSSSTEGKQDPDGTGGDASDVQREDLRALRQWLARGGRLVVVANEPAEKELEGLFAAIFPGVAVPVEINLNPTLLGKVIDLKHFKTPHGPLKTNARNKFGPVLGDRAPGLIGYIVGTPFVEIAVGQGSLAVLLDGYSLSNEGLDDERNPSTIASMLRLFDGETPLYLDTYRHLGHASSIYEAFTANPARERLLWCAIVLGLIYWLTRNIRMRPLRPSELKQRNTINEHIEAVAELYRRARAAPLVLQFVLDRIEALGRYHRTPPSERLAKSMTDTKRLIARGERPRNDKTALDLMRRLQTERRQTHGTR